MPGNPQCSLQLTYQTHQMGALAEQIAQQIFFLEDALHSKIWRKIFCMFVSLDNILK